MQIILNSDEWDVIERCHLLASIKVGATRSTAVQESKTVLELTEDEIDELREACIEQQAVTGFDQEYRLNPVGRVLQELIDKLEI